MAGSTPASSTLVGAGSRGATGCIRRATPRREQSDRRAHRGAQETRRVVVEREAPPQLVAILDVAEGEEPEPDRRRDGHQRRQRPSRRETHFEERRPALEFVAAGQEGEQQERSRSRCLPVAGLEQREPDPEAEQEDGGVVGDVQPAGHSLRHHQQRHADHAAEEVRRLEDPERQKARERRQATGMRRRRTREEQHHSGEEGEDREHLGRHQQRGVAEHGAERARRWRWTRISSPTRTASPAQSGSR